MGLIHLPLGEKSNVRQMPPIPSTDPRDIACVRFSAEQAEEIMANDYTLKLFHATRIEPLSLAGVLERFGEPSEDMAKIVIDRFVKAGILDVSPGDKYFTKYPGNFPNFTEHTYDMNLELNKDARVFKLMKENAGDREYWNTQSYFSTDGFFTEEQTIEIRKKLMDIKFFIKNALRANMEEGSLDGKTFRRHKFYDLVLGSFFAFFILIGGEANASNDPGGQIAQSKQTERMQSALKWAEQIRNNSKRFSSNDPGSLNQQTAFLWRSSLEQPTSSSDGGYGNSFVSPAVTPGECGEELKSLGSVQSLSFECKEVLFHFLVNLCEQLSDETYCSDANSI
ncbi:MAG: hypothetical protein K2Q26_15870 [Bdellovibrionales bacterium]|nr:hypothetical protein [Bdellovibrionales bacterium]